MVQRVPSVNDDVIFSGSPLAKEKSNIFAATDNSKRQAVKKSTTKFLKVNTVHMTPEWAKKKSTKPPNG